MSTPQAQLTGLLIDCSRGNEAALRKLMPLVYGELRRLARQHLRDERAGHTLQTTALVHEAYFKLLGYSEVEWRGRAQFYRAAAQAMRRILVDHARGRKAVKRDFGQRISFNALNARADDEPEEQELDVEALDRALVNLARLDPRKASIVELRYFGGLSIEATAEVVGISPATVKREWVLARLWLFKELGKK
jgi:RNA polymerase sigma-70 factor, ECF subfamily